MELDGGEREKLFSNFFFRLFILIIIVFILDFSIGSILRYYYFKQDSGFLYRTTYSINEAEADIIILGASTANHHYHPAIFEERLKRSYYNAGRDGNSIFYHYAVLKAILLRHTPSIVIFDIAKGELGKFQTSYDRLSSLLPYYNEHKELRPIIELKSRYEKIKMLSNIYPFNSMILSVAVGNSEFNKKRWNEVKGYVPLFRKWSEPLTTDSITPRYSIDSIKVLMYESMIKDCQNSGVELFIVSSPVLQRSTYVDSTIIVGKRIASSYNIPYLDYSDNEYFIKHPDYFEDIFHLNDEGAKVFSNMIIDDIKGYTLTEENNYQP
jgi:hypothetical protein